MFARTPLLAAPLAALLLAGCAYDYPGGYAPQYPAGYDDGMGSGQYAQPGDRFGGQDVASPDVFYDALAPYGRWIDSRFGYAFQPRTAEGWRPYVNGRWGEDRLWISDDPWGWATDHYGRWGYDEQVGWVWVPGTQWAPSWVAFREADQVTGWAPIPPGVNYSVGVGFGSGFGYDNFNSWYGPSWVWVPSPYLYRRGFGGNVLPWNNGINYWRGSRWNYNYGRPNYGRPVYNRPGTARPPVVRPGGGRPDGWNGNRPDRNRPGYERPAGAPGRPEGGNWQGRPEGGNWQGRPEGGNWQGRPDGANWQGRPDRTPGQGRPDGAQWQGRPNRGPDGMRQGGQGRPDRVAVPVAAGTAPPRAEPVRVERAPPPVRAEPQRVERAEPQRSERAERAQSQSGNAERFERPQ